MTLRRTLLLPILGGVIAYGAVSVLREVREGKGPETGSLLAAEQAAALERALVTNPEDESARAQLIGYYFRRRLAASPEVHGEHVLWLVENAPESDALDGPWAQIRHRKDPDGYLAVKEAWLRHTGAEPDNVVFLKHAANFFTFADGGRSASLLEQGEALEPSNPYWAEQLGSLRWQESRALAEGSDPIGAGEALAHFERAYELSGGSIPGHLVKDVSMAAFVAGDLEKARAYAEATLTGIPSGWNRGNRLHFGNLVLGRIALAAGDTDRAAEYLLAAGRTPGSPQLNSFGPDMTLARDLLERGQREAVIRYLRLCLEFWETGQDELRSWIAAVEAGRTPEFDNFLF